MKVGRAPHLGRSFHGEIGIGILDSDQLHIRHGDEVTEVSGVVNRMPMAYLDGGDANGHERVPSPEVRSLIDIDGCEKRSGSGEIQKSATTRPPTCKSRRSMSASRTTADIIKRRRYFCCWTQSGHHYSFVLASPVIEGLARGVSISSGDKAR